MINKFILVDDDQFNNILCTILLEDTLAEVCVKSFTEPGKALEFIGEDFIVRSSPTLLFLDINMPILTGWEFMEEYQKFSDSITTQIDIYILSSSVDQRDMDKASANHFIKGFISKPLKMETVLQLTNT